MIDAFIQKNGVKVLPARHAQGAGYHKATAYGSSREQCEWLAGKPSAKCHEESLANAKILTMLQDLGGRPMGANGKDKDRLRADAYRWFFSRSSDFEAWCDIAGFDVDYVREQAQKIYTEGMPQWRAAPGQGALYAKRKAYREKSGK